MQHVYEVTMRLWADFELVLTIPALNSPAPDGCLGARVGVGTFSLQAVFWSSKLPLYRLRPAVPAHFPPGDCIVTHQSGAWSTGQTPHGEHIPRYSNAELSGGGKSAAAPGCLKLHQPSNRYTGSVHVGDFVDTTGARTVTATIIKTEFMTSAFSGRRLCGSCTRWTHDSLPIKKPQDVTRYSYEQMKDT